MSSVIWRMMSWRRCGVSGVFSTASISVTTSLTFSSRSPSPVPSWLNIFGPSRGMISLWMRVLSSAKGSETTDSRAPSSWDSGSLGSVVATWMRECSDICLPHSPALLLAVDGGDPLGHERVGDLRHRLDDAGTGAGHREGHAAVHRGGHIAVGRQLVGHLEVEGALHLALAQAHLRPAAVQQQ